MIAPKPLTPQIKKLLAAKDSRRMTYIAAFPCKEGFVLCADTQETVVDHKYYVEKLSVAGDGVYPIAIGGAGSGELIDALAQEITEDLLREMPRSDAVESVIKRAV